MIEFTIIYLAIALLAFIKVLFKWDTGIKDVLISLLSAFITSILVGLRPLSAGYDTEVYVNYFNSLNNESIFTFNEVYSYNFPLDYLFKLWTFIISSLNLDAKGFIYITALVSIFLFLQALKKLFDDKYLLVFLIFFATPGFVMLFGNGIRQGLAIPFFLFAIKQFLDKRWNIMLLNIAITLLIHQTSGLILIVTFLAMRVLPKTVFKNRLITFLLFIFLQPLAFYLRRFVYLIYSTGYLTGETSSNYFFHYSFILFLFLYIFHYFVMKNNDIYVGKVFHIYIILTLIPSLFWYADVAYGRVIYLSYPFMSFFLINIDKKFKQKWVSFLLVLLMFAVGVYFYSSDSIISTLT